MLYFQKYVDKGMLNCFLSLYFPKGKWIKNQPIPGSNKKIRAMYRNDSYKLIVEFDSYLHYTDVSILYRDNVTTREADDLGYHIIRVPYFIQLDEQGIQYLFKGLLKEKIKFNDKPHGFVASNQLLPARYCSLGVENFCYELEKLKTEESPILNIILSSLLTKVNSMGLSRVFPINFMENMNQPKERITSFREAVYLDSYGNEVDFNFIEITDTLALDVKR